MALGHVIYDMLMLLASLSVHRKRGSFPNFEGLTWGEPQIAVDVILLKSRVLMDFLAPPRTAYSDSIQIMDYGFKLYQLPSDMLQFRRSVNQWSVHLSWQRVHRSTAQAAQPAQPDMEKHALWLLRTANKFVNEALASGFQLTEDLHRRFLSAFRSQFQKLNNP